ncbi:epoxide hydrolase B-like [Dioscorea cayenensis subsp. rotundata]|uniref:Epoxide hydrolase B-like n=1 Tax=Dioscorea cayennensis subsp. rotundata TaxID=55577 RepID=A0AB40D2W2_DIOCR|nr:epoxide hydrolase B-like [Dioscorea cayenensis subsp. rotundata]
MASVFTLLMLEKVSNTEILYFSFDSIKFLWVCVGESGDVILLHGFPEIWYSWRYQMLALAEAGFRAIAPDCRGYGLSGQPQELDKASWQDLTSDLLGILDTLNIPKAFIVGKDFGTKTANDFSILHPGRVLGVITLGVPFVPDSPSSLDDLPKGFYIPRWREPGRAEKDFGRFEVKRVLRNIYILFCRRELQVAEEDQEIMDLVEPSTPLPHWFTEDDLACYTALYENSGFSYPLQMP